MLRSGHSDRKQQLVWTDTRVEEQDFRSVCFVVTRNAPSKSVAHALGGVAHDGNSSHTTQHNTQCGGRQSGGTGGALRGMCSQGLA